MWFESRREGPSCHTRRFRLPSQRLGPDVSAGGGGEEAAACAWLVPVGFRHPADRLPPAVGPSADHFYPVSQRFAGRVQPQPTRRCVGIRSRSGRDCSPVEVCTAPYGPWPGPLTIIAA